MQHSQLHLVFLILMLLLFLGNLDSTPSLPHNFLRLQHRLVLLLFELLNVFMNESLVFRLLLCHYPHNVPLCLLYIYCIFALSAFVAFANYRVSLAISELQCQLY
jgi:hypothetical protein